MATKSQTKIPKGKRLYVFHHLPRCGGTSTREVFSIWFHLIPDYRPDWAVSAEMKKFQESPIDVSQLEEDDMLAGHFEIEGTFLWQRYPQIIDDSRFQLISFVRNPLEVALSTFYYERKNGIYRTQDLEEHLLEGTHNTLARILGVNESNFLDILEKRYFFIGITEHLQQSFDRLALLLGKPEIQVPQENRVEREGASPSFELITEFWRRNELDAAIYRECFFRFEKRLQEN